MFGVLEKTPDFGYSSVITSTDQFVQNSNCEGVIQFQNKPKTGVYTNEQIENLGYQLSFPEPEKSSQAAANNFNDIWYTPQQFVSSPNFPYFKHPHQQQIIQNNCINRGFHFNDAANYYVPNSCPSLVELMQDTPLSPSIMASQRMQGKVQQQYKGQVVLNNRLGLNNQRKNKAKRIRTAFTSDQIEQLEAVYAKQSYVSKPDRQSLSKQLGITDRAIKVWFQNRRMKGKHDNIKHSESSSADSSNGDILVNIENQVQQCEVNNEYVSVPTEICDKLGALINQFVPKEFMDDHINEINYSLETPRFSISPITSTQSHEAQGHNDLPEVLVENSLYSNETDNTDNKKTDDNINYYIIDDSVNLKYEPISPAEGAPIEMPVWKPEEMKSLFDKHFC